MLTMLAALEVYEVLLPIALVLALSKIFCIIAKRIGLPQVVGMLLTGVLIGLIKLIPNQELLTEGAIEGVKFIAEIGVILIMFSAGLGTDVKQIKATGVAAIVVTILGVVVPMGLGFLVAGACNGFTGASEFTNSLGEIVTVDKVWSNLFYGVILTATSVSVTVATMKELGKLNSKIGTCIISAAILDDIIGVIVLSVVLSLSTGDPSQIGFVLLKTVGFFACVLVLGILMRKLFAYLEKKYEHHRRIPIYGLAFCFFLAYLSEKVFGIADITGAYAAGLILAGRSSSGYVERRADIASYIIFTPVFFAKIGITTDFNQSVEASFILFGILFVVAGIFGKLVGCGLGAKVTGHNFKDSFRCGVGMMCRAEVCLICASKGIEAGLIDPRIQAFILVLIIITSFLTPLLLKLSYKGELYDATEEIVSSQLVEDAALASQKYSGQNIAPSFDEVENKQ